MVLLYGVATCSCSLVEFVFARFYIFVAFVLLLWLAVLLVCDGGVMCDSIRFAPSFYIILAAINFYFSF